MVASAHTAALLRVAAATHPDRDAYVHNNKRATYAWLDRVADGFATTLIGLGVQPGDVVALMLPSSIKFAACYLGALRAGAITSAINGRLGENEQRSILDRTTPAVTVVGDGATPPDGAPIGQVIRVEDLKDAFGTTPTATFPDLTMTDAACIVWTSGTTGIPKGAVYDHARMRAISDNIGQLTEPGDRRLVVLPFPHVGYMTRMWDELANGTTVVIASEPWSAAETLRLIRDEHITMGTGVPTQWELVLSHPDIAATDFSGLRVVGTGGATIAPDLIRRMRETLRCPVITRYTSTEAGVTTSTLVGDPDDVIATTVGRPAPDVELRILPIDGDVHGGDVHGRIVDVGEILSRSPAMMREYWCDPVTTAATIDADGWLHTGDLGVIGDDGNLRIVGRLKEMYIRGGYNVYPSEVEATLGTHPEVAQVAVIGMPEPVLGEIGVAFVVATDAQDPPDLTTLRDWCRSRIADYKAPDKLITVEALPLNATNKVDKASLATTYASTRA